MLAAGAVLSQPLWGTAREYPPTPWLSLPAFPAVLSPWMLPLMVGLLALALVPRRWTPLPFMAVAAVLVLWDQTRLQPWFYQGVLFLGAFALSARPLRTCQLVLAATYLWSGISKLNPDFGPGVLPWALAPLGGSATALVPVGWLEPLGMALGVLEGLVGVALLLPRTRRPAAVAAALMHGLLLLAIGPLGQNWNRVVWPWNLALGALVLLLFWGDGSAPRVILWSPGWYHRLLVVLVGVLPALHPAGVWDTYPSFSLYSMNVDEAWLVADRVAAAGLGPNARAVAETRPDGSLIVWFLPWTMRDIQTPPYPERRVYLAAFRALCERAAVPSGLRLVIRSRQPLTHARPAPELLACRAGQEPSPRRGDARPGEIAVELAES